MIEILDSGYHITIQDRGRFGFSKFGVPLSGSMDYISSNNANSIIGNSIDEPVFEIAMMGGKFLFTEEVDICNLLSNPPKYIKPGRKPYICK